MELIREYWWVIAIVVALVLAFILLRPKQRVSLSDSAPLRPHMPPKRSPEGRGLAGEAAAATSDVAGEFIGARVHRSLDDETDGADDLSRLKGVGPKLAGVLSDMGFKRFDQIAGLTPNEIERIDSQLGAFKGRLARDRVVEQAAYLARNDIDGFEQSFGKLS